MGSTFLIESVICFVNEVFVFSHFTVYDIPFIVYNINKQITVSTAEDFHKNPKSFRKLKISRTVTFKDYQLVVLILIRQN